MVMQVLERVLLDRFKCIAVNLAHLFEDFRKLGPSHAATGNHRFLAIVAHLCTISVDREIAQHYRLSERNLDSAHRDLDSVYRLLATWTCYLKRIHIGLYNNLLAIRWSIISIKLAS